MKRLLTVSAFPVLVLGVACSGGDEKKAANAKTGTPPPSDAAPAAPDAAKLQEQAKASFKPLPEVMENPDNPLTDEKIALGRQLYFDKRLSKNHDVACATCHVLDQYGVDGEPTSSGHKDQKGDRNSPTVYNAGLHMAQFWDGRATDLEDQAKGPILNPVEMAIADEAAAVAVIESIPGYVEQFEKVFPEEGVTYDNIAKAIGAFERKLVTPSPFDAFLQGEATALSEDALRGLDLFYQAGCTTCHTGVGIGGGMYQKLGIQKPYDTKDEGRFEVTNNEADKFIFKVPSLRNITKTAPYLHDGSITTLEDMVALMAEYQTAKGNLSADEMKWMLAFLDSLTGELPTDYIKEPELPESGPKTPAPSPS